MIRLPAPAELTPAERYALNLLVDLSRLLPVDDATADVVRLELVDTPEDVPVRDCVAWKWGLAPGDGVVQLPRSSLHRVTDLAGAVVEQRTSARDRYGRVPPSVNALVAADLEREPIVSRAAVTLREMVVTAAGRRIVKCIAPWPEGKRWAAAFTHDLDVVSWWPLFTLLRLSELGRKGELLRAGRTTFAALGALFGNPVWRGVAEILGCEAAHRIHSTWFILCGNPTLASAVAGDLTYRPDTKTALRIIADLIRRGHAIGLHGSFATLDREGGGGEEFAAQRTRLQRLSATQAMGVRQHFLRLRPGPTHRAMLAAGFTYDSSLGFPDRNGFRLGIADVIPQWDATAEQPLELDEVPFAWMDRALSKYRGVERPDAWVDDARPLISACQDVEGLWVGVWHPNLTAPLGFPGAPAAFARLAQEISAADPYVASLDAIVAWRRARRGIRARQVAPDGRVELAGDTGRAAGRMRLEVPT